MLCGGGRRPEGHLDTDSGGAAPGRGREGHRGGKRRGNTGDSTPTGEEGGKGTNGTAPMLASLGASMMRNFMSLYVMNDGLFAIPVAAISTLSTSLSLSSRHSTSAAARPGVRDVVGVSECVWLRGRVGRPVDRGMRVKGVGTATAHTHTLPCLPCGD